MRRLLLKSSSHERILDVKNCLLGVCCELCFCCIAYEAFIRGEGNITRRDPIPHIIRKDLRHVSSSSSHWKEIRRRKRAARGYLNLAILEDGYTGKCRPQVNPDDCPILSRVYI